MSLAEALWLEVKLRIAIALRRGGDRLFRHVEREMRRAGWL